MPRVGIVTGVLEEAESFRQGAGRARRKTPFYCREHDSGWIVVCAGMGKVNAASVASAMAAEGCEILVSMGVAGRIGTAKDAVYWVDEALQHDYGSYREGAFVPYRAGTIPFGPEVCAPFHSIPDPGLGLPRATILTGDAFIEDPAKSRALSERFGAELVDMETAAIAQVADARGLGWAGIRAVCDNADASGERMFTTNLVTAAAHAAREAGQLIDLLLDPRR